MEAKQPEYNLRAIYVRSSVMSMDDGFDPTIGGQPLTGQFRSHLSSYTFRELIIPLPDGTQQKIRSYEFTTSFSFRYQTPQTDDKGEIEMKTAASIGVDFVSSYERVSTSEASNEELEGFGKTAALVHVWPYFREYCSTAMQKMNLPATLIPLLEVKPLPATTKKIVRKNTKAGIGEGTSPATQRKTTPKKIKEK
ncbi:MAG: hypothetical protein ACYC39_05680 [Thiobacillus sp.]|nr:hypothetical protein [Thiobacillus sp.]